MEPTQEQLQAVDLFAKGRSMVIEAGAGTGKTSTLEMIARSAEDRRGLYMAFNKDIVRDAGARFPGNVPCSTAHSLAYRALAPKFKDRLRRGKRLRRMEEARIMRIDPLTITFGAERKPMSAGYLAGLALRAVARFCQTADAEPSRLHVPYVDGIDVPLPGFNGGPMRKGWDNNRKVTAHIEPALKRAWADITDPAGQLRFEHDHYLKMWQLSHPRIEAEFILFDEAQDARPTMAAVVAEQTHAQVVYVGDSQQAIYEWTGAVNALAGFAADDRTFLTQSFRFGPEIAAVANRVLALIEGADMRLVGTPTIASVVAPVVQPDAVLCRTNAVAVDELLKAKAQGQRPHLVADASYIVGFAKAAQQLMDDGWTGHAELGCFTSWDEVVRYVEEDEGGGDLKLMVNLIEKYGAQVVIEAVERMPAERDADVVISTAHKSKGRQWGSVQLAGDFPPGADRKTGLPTMPDVAELRLLYVAVTRARLELDVTGVGLLASTWRPPAPALPEAVEA